MDFSSMIEALRLKQKKATPKVESTFYVTVRYMPNSREWVVARYDEEGIEMAHERHHLQGAARYIAHTWMDMFNVTRIYVYQMNNIKLKEVIMRGDKGVNNAQSA